MSGSGRSDSLPLKRIAVWVVVGGIGCYLLISGIIGILVKANQ